ncbi:MAG: Eco57I restriction-modification methylase domain-containing protein [Candidatus Fibromonas sp.]|jgi:hypothetical protein|nr:Eco57I restriction-modification methylase domain-containing protein [Candidatus Fibromonas sp.]
MIPFNKKQGEGSETQLPTVRKILSLKQSLNPAFLKQKLERREIELFKKEFIALLSHINPKESEEFHKNLIKDFLNAVYYKDKHYINTKGKTDLVIHNGNSTASPVGVLIETKSPANKAETPNHKNLNVKSFQELVLYYLRERKTVKNFELRYLIITNIYEWFVFDARNFESTFGNDSKLERQFIEFEDEKSAIVSTEKFYKDIASPAIEKHLEKLEYVHFDIRDYDKILRDSSKNDDKKLIALYKFLSPVHLLKLSFANDNNQLNKEFYAELLHIIGLEEVKQDGKKLIVRKKNDNTGSLIETAIHQIEPYDHSVLDESQYGKNREERAFKVAFKLVITWINRILFLKLLEAQILKYNDWNKEYAFLSADKLNNYGDLNELFFLVLACKIDERESNLKTKFAHVPYLNSSLFEQTELEKKAIDIRALGDVTKFVLYSKSSLRNKKHFCMPNSHLEYLLRFLDAYDFSSEGSEDIQEENKPLISASVLGLIFEKINGYKDGSFFTPSFITMYMCRESIRWAVIQKFNESKGWDCQTIEDIHNNIPNKVEDIVEANKIFNSIRICDPSVGSGHFLVSALNEMIYLKSELGILIDKNRKKLKDYSVSVENDELIITDYEKNYFAYNPKNEESQRVQETFFHEKQTIIENCLFGVDINPNSVEICQLRLWIELLKHTYYSSGTLKTLPNIDINIKCGNSLISRFDLHGDNKITHYDSLRKLQNATKEYERQVFLYKNTDNKTVKKGAREKIANIKKDFNEIYNRTDADYKKWEHAENEYKKLYASFFHDDIREKKLEQLQQEADILLNKYEQKIKDFYSNAFEWSFEFPEVMDEDGNFVGFNVVIGNPPYVSTKEVTDEDKGLFQEKYGFADDIYSHFFFKGCKLLTDNGSLTYITSKTFWTTQTKRNLRDLLLSKTINYIFDTANPFEAAMVDTCITSVQNIETKNNRIKFLDGSQDLSNPQQYTIEQNIYLNTQNNVIFKPTSENLKIYELYGEKVKELYNKWWDKISTSKNIEKNKAELEAYRKSLKPGDIALLGCLTEGGQGLATANNGKYIAVRKSTKWAKNILESRPKKLAEAMTTHKIQIPQMAKFNNTADFLKSLNESEIAKLFDDLKEKYGRDIFGQGYIYRLIDDSEMANVDKLTEDEKQNGIPKTKKYYVPYDKGDKDGNRWYLDTPFAIAWTQKNVGFLKANSGKKGEGMPVVRNPQFYFKEGFCWTNILNPQARLLKAKMKTKSVNDVGSMSLSSIVDTMLPDYYIVILLNSELLFNYYREFINCTVNIQINDIRQLPIRIPTVEQLRQCKPLFNKAVELKQSVFNGTAGEIDIERELFEIEQKLNAFINELYDFI